MSSDGGRIANFENKTLFDELVNVAACCCDGLEGCLAHASPLFESLFFAPRLGLAGARGGNTRHEKSVIAGCEVDKAAAAAAAIAHANAEPERATAATAGRARVARATAGWGLEGAALLHARADDGTASIGGARRVARPTVGRGTG
ncbi:hypothetical protein BN1708_000599 [Verticillium longisporum]|uniref:Uncharacterized protein n=1 Tax=Verticillium longisporum TaxID=100787 RepID=A0A0G4LXU2_VERLO|nr:hypothetical protein BN1708_000599 [Verticillium longisporum]